MTTATLQELIDNSKKETSDMVFGYQNKLNNILKIKNITHIKELFVTSVENIPMLPLDASLKSMGIPVEFTYASDWIVTGQGDEPYAFRILL